MNTSTSRARRRARRLAVRQQAAAKAAIALKASGSTSLALGDRDQAWDASAAENSLTVGQYADAHFWTDPKGDPETKAAYKLPFALNDGGLKAVWKGVTAAAGALSGARGGVAIPDADVAGVKAKIAAYYTKAAEKYDDPEIKPPWESESASITAAQMAFTMTRAEFGFFDESTEPESYAPVFDYWLDAFSHLDTEAAAMQPNSGKCADCGHGADLHSGEMNGGACAMKNCDCEAFDDGKTTEAKPIAEAFVRIRPYTDGFEEAVEAVVTRTIERANARLKSGIVTDGNTDSPFVLVPGVGTPEHPFTLATDDTAANSAFTISFGLNDFRPIAEITADDMVGLGRYIYEVRDDMVANGYAPLAPPGDLPPEHQPQDRKPRTRKGPAAPSATVARAGALAWSATIAPEGKLTDDGRAFAPDSIKWRELPLSLGSMLDTPHADTVTDSQVCGRIDNIWRDGNLLKASGVFDAGDRGQEIARMVSDGTVRGVSVDLAVNSYEVGPKTDWFDADGNWAPKEPETADAEDEGGGLLDLLFGGEDSIFVVTDGTIGAVTVCPFPAFAEATIQAGDSVTAGANPAVWKSTMQFAPIITRATNPGPGLTASAAGLIAGAPPIDWFGRPDLDEALPMTVDDDGRVYGYAATWDVCHIGIAGGCTTAPHTASNYAYYHLKEVVCEDGERVACGTVTLATGHAHRNLGRADAAAHYDNTGTAVADVVVGEDELGIWVSGALRGDVSEEKARELRGATLSGDWRDVNGNLELVALLAVNVPGFPIPRRTRAVVASGFPEGQRTLTLISAGLAEPEQPIVTQRAMSPKELAQFDAIRSASEYEALRPVKDEVA